MENLTGLRENSVSIMSNRVRKMNQGICTEAKIFLFDHQTSSFFNSSFNMTYTSRFQVVFDNSQLLGNRSILAYVFWNVSDRFFEKIFRLEMINRNLSNCY